MKAATVGKAKCILKIWMDAETAVSVRLNVMKMRLKTVYPQHTWAELVYRSFDTCGQR